MSFSKISENLFLFEDICNVYVVKNKTSCLLINSGRGKVVDSLDKIGVKRIDWILHTHHFRDLCQGDHRLIKVGAKVAVPDSESNLFRDAKGFWERFNLFSRYEFTPTTFIPCEDIPVAVGLKDNTEFSWFDLHFQIFKTPGPTIGSISILSEIDGIKVAFTGDLIYSPGKVWNLHNLQRHYNDACREGVSDTLKSLEFLKSQKVEMLLPSHGILIKDIPHAISTLKRNLNNVIKALSFHDKIENNGWCLLPHLFYKNTSYFIVSKSGKIMIYDYIGGERFTFSDVASQRDLDKIMYEVKSFKGFDIVLASHYHDDHVAGFNRLREKYGTKIWAYENMVDILENPSNYNLTCLFEEPIKVDRVLRDSEMFQWEEYTFTIYHFPGQTEYHMAMCGIIDGKKVLFVGDSALSPSTIFRAAGINSWNYCRLEEDEGVMKCAKIMLELKPDYVLPSHRGLVTITERRLNEYLSWAKNLKKILAEATAQSDVNMGWDQNWVSLYPYLQKTMPGEKIKATVNIRNHLGRNTEVTVNLDVPDKWKYSPLRITKAIPAKSTNSFNFNISTPSKVDSRRKAIGVNVVFDGRDWGDLAEAIIEFHL